MTQKNRGRLEILAEILAVCSSGEHKCNMGRIMLVTKISYTQFKAHMDELLKYKLIEISGIGEYANEKIYRATETGIKFMRDVQSANSYLNDYISVPLT